MSKKAQAQAGNTNDSDRFTDPEVVSYLSYRFKKAFPELGKCFKWLNGGYAKGAAWQPLLVAYVKRIGPKRSGRLAIEVGDVRVTGVADGELFKTLICHVLGLNEDLLVAERLSVDAFLGDMQSILLELTRRANLNPTS